MGVLAHSIYDNIDDVLAAKDTLATKIGFADYPEGFRTYELELNNFISNDEVYLTPD